MVSRVALAALLLVSATAMGSPAPARAADMPKLALGISGWTGFSPLVLAEKEGLFKKHGADVEIKFIGQKDRLAAFAAGAVQGVATTVDTQVVWAGSVPLSQVLVLDRSKGADGLVVKPDIANFQGLKGKSMAVDGPGTTPYFFLAYALIANKMSLKDLKLSTLDPQAAAQAFVAGQFDAASTYEPYISQVRAKPETGKVLASTTDYPVICDTLAFQTDYIKKNRAAVAAVVAGWFDALALIKAEPDKSYAIMGASVKQSAAEFKDSAQYIEWIDHKANQDLMGGFLQDLAHTATQIQLQAGVIRKAPSESGLVDASFVK